MRRGVRAVGAAPLICLLRGQTHTVMLEEDWIDGCAKRGDCADYDKMYGQLKLAGLREVEVISSYENGLRKLVWSKNRMPAHRGPACYVPPVKGEHEGSNAQYAKTISQVLAHIQDTEAARSKSD